MGAHRPHPLIHKVVNRITAKILHQMTIGVYQPCLDLTCTLVAMSERIGMSISQVTDEVLYTGLIEMQELPELED